MSRNKRVQLTITSGAEIFGEHQLLPDAKLVDGRLWDVAKIASHLGARTNAKSGYGLGGKIMERTVSNPSRSPTVGLETFAQFPADFGSGDTVSIGVPSSLIASATFKIAAARLMHAATTGTHSLVQRL